MVTSISELGPHCFGSESEIVQSINNASHINHMCAKSRCPMGIRYFNNKFKNGRTEIIRRLANNLSTTA